MKQAFAAAARDLLNSLKITLISFSLIVGAVTLLNVFFTSLFIDLRSVHVAGETVTVDRSIKSDFWGSYTVTVRRVEDDRLICVGVGGPFKYLVKASDKNPVPFSLGQWISEAPGTLDLCNSRGFDKGRFYLASCHQAYLLGLPIAGRCVNSNTFERGAE